MKKKNKAAKVNVQAADSHDSDANMITMDGLPSTLTGTKANASGKDDNAREREETERGKDMEKQATVANGSKVSVCCNRLR